MGFTSSVFLFLFLPILLLIYYFSNPRYQNLILLLASVIFYAWGEPKYIFLMLLSILMNYWFGILINKFKAWKKIFLIIAILYNLTTLFVFKYLNFFGVIFAKLTSISVSLPNIALPIGISFFTFQIMSYTIDVYKEKIKVQKNILNLALYVSLFPQLIAGPIVRYTDIEEQIKGRISSLEKIYKGLLRFAIGFSKKVLLADQLAPLVDEVFTGIYPSLLANWVGILAYTLQIYFDFSGYSDMAIGLGKMFGFDFLENFNYPYISRSIKEFWRRWHISLSSWFKDYLYIPLGGSQKGTVRTYVNLLIVFFLTGLWHGASFNFIIWGLFYVLFLIIERSGFGKILEMLPKLIQHIYALLVIMIGWVFFRADGINNAISYIKGMFIPYGKDIVNFNVIINWQYIFCIVLGIFFSIPHIGIVKKIRYVKCGKFLEDLSVIIVFIFAICYMIGSGYSPFLYFKF